MIRQFCSLQKRTLAFTSKFFSGQNAYVASLYEHWKKDKESVGPKWNAYFSKNQFPPTQPVQQQQEIKPSPTQTDSNLQSQIDTLYKVHRMLKVYHISGHLLADVDPLHLEQTLESGKKRAYNQRFDLSSFGFTEAELNRKVYLGAKEQRQEIAPFLVDQEEWTPQEIYEQLGKVFRGKVSIEYIHLANNEEKYWMQSELFELSKQKYDPTHQLKTLYRLCRAEMFNEFLKNRFTTSKRFGIEGLDTLISGLNAVVDQCASYQIDNVVLGMAHRGRLNTLCNVLYKTPEQIFAEFTNVHKEKDEEQWGSSGDVKYHLGTTVDKEFEDGHVIRMTLLPNASHLESANSIVQGKTRALQDLNPEKRDKAAVAIQIHGDASFAGQGIVYETLQMWNLKGYSTQGTIHIILNNQIGFTTTPMDARTGLYCSDIARSIDSPVIHVNSEDADMVDAACKLAVRYRQKYKKDIVIDLVGYRKYGHNEQDQPAFTQPMMYKKIPQMKPIFYQYAEKLVQQGITTKQVVDGFMKKVNDRLDKAYKAIRNEEFNKSEWLPKPWEVIRQPTKHGRIKDTGVPANELKEIGKKITTFPKDLEVHKTIEKIYQARAKSLESGKAIDFPTAESLAFATLVDEGYSVRLSGEDCERLPIEDKYSLKRHCVVNHQKRDFKYYPIRQLIKDGERNFFEVYNSLLSEYGVLGYEYGYSLQNPNCLTLWEGQFGDFANGGQIAIDNYICSGETKWGVQSGLVVLLPHGMDGQGPEHSSARIERYLQLMDDDPNLAQKQKASDIRSQIFNSNMQVCICTTAANYFHVLRRQIRRDFRKPLILFENKKLMKFARASSDIELFDQGTRFHRLIPDSHEGIKPAQECKKVVLCAGQMFYEIFDRRAKLKKDDIAIVRIEQLAPFPYDHFKIIAAKYPNAQFIVCQEEHQNSGIWGYLEPRVHNVLSQLKKEGVLKNSQVMYVGRKPSSSTAAGSGRIHNFENEKIYSDLFH